MEKKTQGKVHFLFDHFDLADLLIVLTVLILLILFLILDNSGSILGKPFENSSPSFKSESSTQQPSNSFWGTTKTPYPTNTFWTNLVLGEGTFKNYKIHNIK